jgi:hypothetical protein
MRDVDEPAGATPSIDVAVVCICSAGHLARCLDALAAQQGAPPFRVVVRYDPTLPDMEALGRRHPGVDMGCRPLERTPLELAAAALRECRGEFVLLTEDHCVPGPDWVRRMLAARRPDRAAVGGRVETAAEASAVDWAFYYVDFFRYAAPAREGPSPTLTVCNVAYDRDRLEAVREVWAESFEEPHVHGALRQRFGVLWMAADSQVTMRRAVSLGEALRERYAFGRIFGHTRAAHMPPGRRALYSVLALALPVLLLGRMTAKALRSPALLRRFAGAFVPLVGLVLCWSCGEWLGYVTGRPPNALVLAPERDSGSRTN